MLVNMKSKDDAEQFVKTKGLGGAALHAVGNAPADYGVKYIPHKVLLDKSGVVLKNALKESLPGLLDSVLSGKTD